MRVTKNFPPALQLLKNLIPSDKKPIVPYEKKMVVIPELKPPECLRCGRQDHQTLKCTAKYDINGYEIGKPI